MVKFIKTDYENAPDYITPGKEYEIIEDGEFGGWFTCDTGETEYIYFSNSAHLNCRAWEVIERD